MLHLINRWSHFLYVILLWLCSVNATQAQNIISLQLPDSNPNSIINLAKWEIQDLSKDPSSNTKWVTVSASNCNDSVPFNKIQVFRKLISVDSTLVGVTLTFIISHYGASSFFVDDHLIAKNGTPSDSEQDEIRIDPKHKNSTHTFFSTGTHTLIVQYSNHLDETLIDQFNGACNGFEMLVCRTSSDQAQGLNKSGLFAMGFMVVIGILIALSLLHFLIYLLYKEKRSNLYFSLFTFSFAILIILFELSSRSNSPELLILSYYLRWRMLCPVFYFLLLLVYSVVKSKNDEKWRRYTNRISAVLIGLLFLVPALNGTIVFFILVVYLTTACFVTGTLLGTQKRVKGDGLQIVKFGFQIFIYFAGIYFIISNFFKVSLEHGSWGEIFVFLVLCLGILSIPISMSVYLAYTFAKNNKDLALQLAEVEKLSALTIEQERQRKILLEKQNEELEMQVKLRTSEVVAQREELAEKNKEIIDSINYAKRIQNTLLAHKDLLNDHLGEYFIYFNPKDIVSGDFYWAANRYLSSKTQINEEGRQASGSEIFFLAVCDSTGHGVPGAFMSLLNIGFLTEAINEKEIVEPGEVFNFVRQRLMDNISKEGQRDGFDGVLIAIEKGKNEIKFAAANNRPVLVRRNELVELESDRMPVGAGEKKNSFNTYTLRTEPGDTLYIYTDGFADQFGGPKGKKFKYKHLNEFLLAINSLPVEMQKDELQKMFEQWKGDLEQVDDVCIAGIRF